jgi:cell division protein FtsI/penicillin-binding protein 2
MSKHDRPLFNRHHQSGWRSYQTDLRRETTARRFWRRLAALAVAGGLLALVAIFGLQAFFRHMNDPAREMAASLKPAAPVAEPISKDDVRQLLDEKAFRNLTKRALELPVEGQVLQVETTLDTELQNFLLRKIDREHSRHVGIVVMEPATGRVLAMASFDKTDPAGNPCLRSHFPAASIFKIVTAASAVDQCGYTAESPLQFNGNKHTLYKRQLVNAVDRYTTTISLKEAFADSVNPVFGKIGQHRLGKPLLEKSADAFGFNEPLDFELSLPPSRFLVQEQPYHWAEVASGFNRDTTISPLHGAVMAAAVLNAGRMVAPSIVDRIVDTEGNVLYRWQPDQEQQAMSARAATVLKELMETTITSGTGRKAFRNHRRDKVLSRLQIGGKTGSIDNESHDVRYDWFVGFARERQGQGQVVIAAMVGHEKYIGTRASEYARMAITHYFGHHTGSAAPLSTSFPPPGPGHAANDQRSADRNAGG